MAVEGIANQHPNVLESSALPMWAHESEQEIMITVTLIPSCSLEPESLIYFLNERMPYFVVPRYIDLVDEIIRTPTGKTRKYKLRERGLTNYHLGSRGRRYQAYALTRTTPLC